eukprot:13125797-Alexandrium_andersonii.AAC.1
MGVCVCVCTEQVTTHQWMCALPGEYDITDMLAERHDRHAAAQYFFVARQQSQGKASSVLSPPVHSPLH